LLRLSELLSSFVPDSFFQKAAVAEKGSSSMVVELLIDSERCSLKIPLDCLGQNEGSAAEKPMWVGPSAA